MTESLPASIPLDRKAGSVTPKSEANAISSFGSLARQLSSSLSRLEEQAKSLSIPSLAGREWFDLFNRKLLPQLTDDAYLVVAVVGGTNIGKSVIFNHIAGFRASSSSPLASGTKHPVCLIPTGFETQHDLQALFPAFELRPRENSDTALESHSEHCLFWQSSEVVPPNLVIFDTPDVDSDAPVNWQRADAVRQAADVLVAVLTQQKYNDAAVKQFFRKAAAEEKEAIIVFNRVELPDDEPYWPLWLKTFTDETGLKPRYVYLAPNDRKAAEAIQLPFEERKWNVASDDSKKTQATEAAGSGKENLTPARSDEQTNEVESQPAAAIDLRSVLSQLRFAEIKLKTMRGSLKQLVSEYDGAPAYLREVRSKSQQFRDAADVFATRGLIQQADWPAAPNSLIVDEMWKWWDSHRESWTSNIHRFYSNVGRLVNGGYRIVRNQIWGVTVAPLDEYRRAEWDAIVRAIQQVYDQLRMAAALGNELLTNRLEKVLAGATCESLLERLHREQSQFDFELMARTLVESEMTALKDDHRDLFGILKNIDQAAAVVRPALTVLLALGGGFGAEHLLMHAASQSVTHVAIDATAAAGTTMAGEAVVETATGALGQAKAWLLQLHEKFKAQREAWLIAQLKEHLLGDLQAELQRGATVPYSAAYLEVKKLIQKFEDRLAASEI